MTAQEIYDQDVKGITQLLIQLNYNEDFFNLSKEMREELRALLLTKFTIGMKQYEQALEEESILAS